MQGGLTAHLLHPGRSDVFDLNPEPAMPYRHRERFVPWDPPDRRGIRAFDGGAPADPYGARRGERRMGDRRQGERRRGERRRSDRRELERGQDWRERWRELRTRAGEDDGLFERGRAFIRRYRQPIIGLTMAGAAAPMAKGTEARPAQPPPEAMQRQAMVSPEPGDLDEAVGERWATAQAEQLRADTIEGAMVRYGIDRDLAEDIFDAAVANDIEPDIAFGLVNTESTFDHRAVSHVGARGLTQVMPRTAQWLRPGTTAEDLFDRHLNLDLGFSYLRDLIDKYDGNVRLALLAYNRGPGTVDRVLRQGGDPNNGYADRVLGG